MNTPVNLEALFARRDALADTHNKSLETLDRQIGDALMPQWADWKELTKARAALESAKDFGIDPSGIYAWVRFSTSDVAERERPYFDDYLLDLGLSADYLNDALVQQLGPTIIINTEPRNWYVLDQDSGNEVELDDFTDTDGDVDKEKLAWLLEAYMERTGCFPGVFTCDRHGNVYAFETLKRAEAYAKRLGFDSVAASHKATGQTK